MNGEANSIGLASGLGTGQVMQRLNRRAFLRDCARYPLLAGLAVLGGWLAWRESTPDGVEPCVKQRVCKGCQLFAGCARPQAVATRKES